MSSRNRWLELLIPPFHRVVEEMERVRREREELIVLVSGLRNENEGLQQQVEMLRNANEEVQRQLERHKKTSEGLQQEAKGFQNANDELRRELETRQRISERLQQRVKKQEGVVSKLNKRLEGIQLERNEVYSQYNRLLSRLSDSEEIGGGAGAFGREEVTQGDRNEMAESQGRRLNIGCGRVKKLGYLNVDVDPSVKPDLILRLDASLPFGSNIFELVEAYHVIEHLYPWMIYDILTEFLRILRPGGRLAIECPSIESACSWLASNSEYGWDSQMGMWAIYGDPNPRNPLYMHKWGYTPVTLAGIFREAGFVEIKREVPEAHIPARDFRIVATKSP